MECLRPPGPQHLLLGSPVVEDQRIGGAILAEGTGEVPGGPEIAAGAGQVRLLPHDEV